VDDVISSGPDREPRWPRWRPGRRLKVVAACVTLAVAAALIWYLPGLRHPGGQARPGSLAGGLATQDDGSAAAPDPLPTQPALMTGRPLPRGASLRLLAGGQTPAWVLVPSGRTEPIRGLRKSGNGYQLFRVAGGWAAQPFPPAASQLMVATLASGRTAAVPGTTVGSGIGVTFGWQPGSRLLIADVAAGLAGHVAADAPGQAEWQLAVWQPGDARLATALAQTPAQSWPVIAQGPY
jgi:hypothetical protein